MKQSKGNKKASSEVTPDLIAILKSRFEKNMDRHKGLEWAMVQARLEVNDEKVWSLGEMERTGGEPDVVGFDKKSGGTFFSIVLKKARRAAEAFVTTATLSNRGKNTNLRTAPSMRPRPWGSNF